MDTTCNDILARMERLRTGECDASFLKLAEAHLAQCSSCRQIVQRQSALAAAIHDELAASQPPLPNGMNRRLLASITIPAQRISSHIWIGTTLAALAAGVVIALGLSSFFPPAFDINHKLPVATTHAAADYQLTHVYEEPTGPLALLCDMTTGNAYLAAANDAVPGLLVQSITTNAVTCQKPAGDKVTLTNAPEAWQTYAPEIPLLFYAAKAGGLNPAQRRTLLTLLAHADAGAAALAQTLLQHGGAHATDQELQTAWAGVQGGAVLDHLVKVAVDRSHTGRAQVIGGFGKIDSPRSIVTLRSIAGASDDPCRAAAMQSLAQLGDQDSLPNLRRVADDVTLEPTIREAARQALKILETETK